ncbi:F0F1 ATP synthase subunit delta, partial [Microbacterium gubbeenense]
IVRHLVLSPRGRRIRPMLASAQKSVADATGESLATVTTARQLPAAQLSRLTERLQQRYGRSLRLSQVIDPSIIGGLRVTVGDEVIDGTIRSKYNDLRLKLG